MVVAVVALVAVVIVLVVVLVVLVVLVEVVVVVVVVVVVSKWPTTERRSLEERGLIEFIDVHPPATLPLVPPMPSTMTTT